MTRTILLADDSVTIQKVIELTFMDDDYRVVAVSNGDEALAKLEGARPDIVLADVHMPGTNGYGVARRAKERWPGVPVLLLVGTFEPFDEAEARACGADGFMKKPFDSQELQQRVELLIGGTPAAAATPVAAPEPVLPPPPAAFGTVEEDTPRRVGFDFSLESEPAAPEVLPVVETQAETVFTPAFSFSEPVAVAPVTHEWHAEPPAAELVAPPVPEPVFEPVPVAAPPVAVAGTNGAIHDAHLSDDDVDRIARRVIDLLGDKPVRDVAWEVVPDLAEMVIRERLRELESQVD
ncbi:MAG: response regulator [Thermoanaerobaculia bacterium]|nr:response regulator [Thermoanaerobaculia bacterium]